MKKKEVESDRLYNSTYSRSGTLTILLLFSTLIFQNYLCSQLDDIKFEQISVEQGLSQSTAYCIMQDKQGFIWVGTQNGLNRYDGYTFKVYTHIPTDEESLSHYYVICIYEDELSDILWIGTEGGGLSKFDRKTEKFTNFKNNPEDPQTLSNNNVRAIHIDKLGTLWLGTDYGLNKFDRDAKKFKRFLKEVKINSILRDSSGKLWVGTDKGLFYYDQEKKDFIAEKYKKKTIEEYPIPQNIKVIYEDMKGIFWLGTDSGLYKFIHKRNTIIHEKEEIAGYTDKLKDKQISSIAKDLTGNLWIGTQSDGLFIYNPEKKNLIHHYKKDPPDSLSKNFVRSIYVDRYEIVWIGTDGGGINKYDPKRKKFNLFRSVKGDSDSLSNEDIMAICYGKNGIIWNGTWGNGLYKFEPQKNKYKFFNYEIPIKHSKKPGRNKIRAICEDHNGVLWIGTDKAGLYIFKPEQEQFEQYKDKNVKADEDVLCIYVDEENDLWIGSMGSGLIRIDENREKVTRYENTPGNPKSISNNNVYSVCGGNPGELWIGTGGGGLNKFNKEKGSFIHYKPEKEKPNTLSHNFILTIFKDRSGTLWIGTKGGGINKFDSKNNTFTAYSKRDGLSSDVIYAILDDDDNNLWLSTNKGLSRFTTQTGEFRNYTTRDGLQGYEFNRSVACKSDNGELFFGGINGLNSFFPKEISDKERKEPPPVVFTSFKMRGLESKLNYSNAKPDPLKLSFRDDFISFEFAALSFSAPEKNQYAYKLESSEKDNKDDKNWIYLGNKHDVDLVNLEPGKYTLKVKGSNSDGFWNEQGTEIKIIVTPPFTKTWWFYISLLLSVSGFILGFVRWRINNIKNTNRILQKEIDERLVVEEKLRENEKLYRTLIETSPDAIALYDSDIKNGTIVMANLQVANLLGFTDVDDLCANVKNIFDLIDERDKEKANKSIAEIVKEIGVNKNTEYTLRKKDDTLIPVEINTSLIKDDHGNPRYLLSIARDISSRKEAEKKEKMNREKLIQVDRMVSLGRLLSGVSHELNNPAASIKMNSEIFARVWRDTIPVLDRYYQDNKRFSLADIPYLDAKKRLEDLIIGLMEGSHRIEKIIHDLRDFSRPGDHSTYEPIDVNKVIRSSINLTNSLIMKRTRYFSERLASNLPPIIGNFQKMEQVFINLIRNACQALPDTDKFISIKSMYDKANKQVVITVKDGGEGIDEKYLKFITDPFFTTRRKQGGIGLGLAISMQIIQEHHGTMKFQSQKAKGTTVSVSLPVIE